MASNIASLRMFGRRLLPAFAPRERDMPYLEPAAAVVRMLFGLIVIHRAVDNLGMTAVAGSDPATAWLSGVVALGGLLLTVGLLTPVIIVGLLIYYAYWPIAFSLGTMISVQLLWGLLLLEGGRRLSLDARLIRSRVAPWLGGLYLLSAPTERWAIAKVRFLLIGLFWATCLTAMLYHLNDQFWLKGQVLQFALTAPYLSDHYALMTRLQRQYPWIFTWLCQVGLGVQAIWEICLLPLMYTRWTRVFVVLQGLAFFTVSLVLMNLQYLPLVEMLLWLLIFGPSAAGWFASRWPTSPSRSAWRPSAPKPLHARFTRGLILTAGFAAASQVLLSGPLVPERALNRALNTHERLTPLFSAFGQARVEVLNKKDVEMATAHLVLQEVDAVGRHLRVVPLNDLEGGRLDYLRNNLVYYNHSLRWRRSTPEQKFVDADPTRPSDVTRTYARKIATLDAALTGSSRPRRYRAHVFVREMRLDATPPRWSGARPTASFSIALTPQDMNAHRHVPNFDMPPGQAFSAERLGRTDEVLAKLPRDTAPSERR